MVVYTFGINKTSCNLIQPNKRTFIMFADKYL